MVIDKTTGRGCAWGLAARPITKKLLAEGIVGKVIAKKLRYKQDVLLRVIDRGEDRIYVSGCFADEAAEEPLWVPSFLDAEIWARAVGKFQIRGRLDDNVAAYLLPEMEEYLQGIPDTELASMTRDFLIEQGVLHKPVCQRGGKTYYFNENEVYSLDKGAERFPYEGQMRGNTFRTRGVSCFNMNVWSKAASRFQTGMTLEECIGIFLKTELTHRPPQEPSSLDRLVQYIAPPVYERDPENRDEAAFDRIRVTVGLPRYRFHSWEALRGEVKKYEREIYRQVIQRLENDCRFKKYDVPIGSLKLSNVMLLRDFSIEFIFERDTGGTGAVPPVRYGADA